MAFFGIRWVASEEGNLQIRACEMSPLRISESVVDIREKGFQAAKNQYTLLQQEYATAYEGYQVLQTKCDKQEEKASLVLKSMNIQTKKTVEAAGRYLLQKQQQNLKNNSKLEMIMQGLDPHHREVVENILFPLYMTRNQLEECENGLWLKHSSLHISEEVYNLWLFEKRAGEIQIAESKEKEHEEKEQKSLYYSVFQERLTEIRSKNKEKKRLRKVENRFHVDLGSEKSSARRNSAPSHSQNAPPLGHHRKTREKKNTETSKVSSVDARKWL